MYIKLGEKKIRLTLNLIFPLILLLFSTEPQGPTEKSPCPSFPGIEVSGLVVNMAVVAQHSSED